MGVMVETPGTYSVARGVGAEVRGLYNGELATDDEVVVTEFGLMPRLVISGSSFSKRSNGKEKQITWVPFLLARSSSNAGLTAGILVGGTAIGCAVESTLLATGVITEIFDAFGYWVEKTEFAVV